MSKSKDILRDTIQYVEFLEKRLASANYKKNVTPEEYQKTEAKLKKARFLVKMYKPKK